MTETTENLQKYEELFGHRFSSEDHEYQEYLNRPADPPPIVEDFRSRGGGNQRGRDNRYQDRRGHRGGWGHPGWRGGHHGQKHWRDRDRHWGHGSGYQSGAQSSNQGYNFGHQRSHDDHH
uniref:RNMT-activating mini protein n=1 Tax=Monopterus albus TaxID=43700 RepID=UPI0009B426F2|nr:RNMT-activating mini protein [Monopterus albus]XP_020461459.1 RNMT-activating mini protein [Monopterus albus]